MPQVIIDASKVVRKIPLNPIWQCIACNAIGKIEIDKHGYPHDTKGLLKGYLRHAGDCPMNECLNEDGTLKEDIMDQKPKITNNKSDDPINHPACPHCRSRNTYQRVDPARGIKMTYCNTCAEWSDPKE